MRSLTLAMLGLLCWAAPVRAHALGASLRIDKERVQVQALYDDRTPARAAVVVVLDSSQETVARGKTDAKGLWSFQRPQPGEYEVRVDAGDGHLTVKKLIISTASAKDAEGPNQLSDKDVSFQGDDLEEFTRFRWLQLGIGIATIALVAVAFLATRTYRRGSSSPLSPPADPPTDP